jgi:hypothetical protein
MELGDFIFVSLALLFGALSLMLAVWANAEDIFNIGKDDEIKARKRNNKFRTATIFALLGILIAFLHLGFAIHEKQFVVRVTVPAVESVPPSPDKAPFYRPSVR